MQETPVRSLIQEDPTCCRATEPVCPNSWACSVESRNHNHWAQKPQLLKPAHPRAHALQQEKPCQWEAHAPPLESRVCSLQTEKSPHDHRDPAEPKTSNFLIHERKKSNFRKNACHMYKLQEFLHMHYNNDTRMFMAAKNCQQTQLPVGESDKSQDMQGEVTERMQGVLIHWHRKTSVLGFFRDKTNTHTYVHLSQQKTQGSQYSSPSPRTDVPAHSQTRGASSSATCLFYWGLQMAGQGPPTLGRAIRFVESTNSRLTSSRNTLRDTLRIMLGRVFGLPRAYSGSHMKSAFTTPASSVEIWLSGCRGPDSI